MTRYELAALIPVFDRVSSGRRRSHPGYVLILYEALISVYVSARQVGAELSHPRVWGFIRRKVRELHPERRDLHLPAEPMRRHHPIPIRPGSSTATARSSPLYRAKPGDTRVDKTTGEIKTKQAEPDATLTRWW